MRDNTLEKSVNHSNEENCIDDELLFRYLDKNTTEQETERVQQHLNRCETCFSVVASVIRNEEDPISEPELAEVSQSLSLTPEEQVEKILSFQQSTPSEPRRTESEGRKKSLFDLRPIYLRYAAAAAILLAALNWGVRYYQVGYQVMRAENLLQENHRIFVEDVRLSGEYASTGISKTMGDREEVSYLDQAASRLKGALDHDPEASKARRLLAQVAIIEGNFDRADSLLSDLKTAAKTPAHMLNDLGVLAYRQKNWDAAVERFQAAIEADPGLREARYNLALARLKQGREQEAAEVLERYIELETDELWKRAAMRLRQKIE